MESVLHVFDMPLAASRSVGRLFAFALRHLKDHFIPHARNNYHPHILGHRALGLFSALLIATKIFTIVLMSFGPVLPAFSSAITVENIITLTNQSRKDFSLGLLAENQILNKAAQSKADDMLAKGYFAHTTPEGQAPWSFITAAGYNYLMAGENLAVNFLEAEDVETAWMNSPGHKANILNKNFEEIGIGISQGEFQGHTAIFVVQMFGVPAEQKIFLTDKPTPVQKSAVPIPAAPADAQVAAADVKGIEAPVAAPLGISDAQVNIENDQVTITAQTTGDPVKVLAYFGGKAVMLSPKSGDVWAGQTSLAGLANGGVTVKVKAFDIKGMEASKQLADFTNSTVSNYNIVTSGSTPAAHVSWMGRVFDVKAAESRFYMLFSAGMMSTMVLAIGIKRHIQHLSLVTNGSFVVILACMLWMAG